MTEKKRITMLSLALNKNNSLTVRGAIVKLLKAVRGSTVERLSETSL